MLQMKKKKNVFCFVFFKSGLFRSQRKGILKYYFFLAVHKGMRSEIRTVRYLKALHTG